MNTQPKEMNNPTNTTGSTKGLKRSAVFFHSDVMNAVDYVDNLATQYANPIAFIRAVSNALNEWAKTKPHA